MAKDLPEDCLESIFKKLSNHDFKHLSLVSHQFYSLTNNLIFHLKVSNSQDHLLLLPRLLNRFTSLKSIVFYYEFPAATRDASVVQIAHSGLGKLEKLDLGRQKTLPLQGIKQLGSINNMRTLKILRCANVLVMDDADLSVLASSLPWLQELDISCDPFYGASLKVTDQGIIQLAAMLPDLLRINMSFHKLISDLAIHGLMSSCARIQEIRCFGCYDITFKASTDAICGYPNLISLEAGRFEYVRRDPNCCYLRLSPPTTTMDIGEIYRVLASIDRARLPLHKLILHRISDCTDRNIASLLKFLRRLRAIELSCCCMLTNATFCLIVENCPALTEFAMCETLLGKESGLLVLNKKHRMIKSLKLDWNDDLDNETLKRIVLSFPNLECLQVCHSSVEITEESIGYVLSNCPKIKELRVDNKAIINGDRYIEYKIDDKRIAKKYPISWVQSNSFIVARVCW